MGGLTVTGGLGRAGGERIDEVNLKSREVSLGGDRLGGGDRVKPAAETRGPALGTVSGQ